ncbi:MAG: GNAT family N-acetyltransferase [Gammaproteobacteria bacterium]|nr:GNAT family N-acetyltransferase [Gammaproteobacteria bacterium]
MSEISELGEKLQEQGALYRHRHCIIVSGHHDWCLEVSHELITPYNSREVIYLGESPSPVIQSLNITNSQSALGREFESVVYDSHDQFCPDALGVISGTVLPGGLLIILTPKLADWPKLEAGHYGSRFSPHGYVPAKNNFYIQYVINVIRSDPRCLLLEQGSPISNIAIMPRRLPESSPDSQPVYIDQELAIEGIKKVVKGQRHRPAVLLSDRGRGKSAALGLASGQLIREGLKRILITSHNRQSVSTVFKHAESVFPSVGKRIEFFAVDKLLIDQPSCDLLIVDEAACIPLSLLDQLLRQYSRIAFASTVHGYEGTGQSFVLKFQKIMDEHTRGWKRYRMEQPIRWAPEDPLEGLMSRLLVLDSRVAPKVDRVPDITKDLEFEKLDPTVLTNNEPLLREVFGLLTIAHYRTRTSDLRHLLDAPNLLAFRLITKTHTIAIALVSLEGGLSEELSKEVWLGKTRPKGHLLTESLLAQMGLKEAGGLKTARIVRIVVRPELQGSGIGTLLVKKVTDILESQVDLIGTSFGLEEKLMRFWNQTGFRISRIGLSRSSHTGTHSCLFLKPLSATSKVILENAAEQLLRNLPYQLPRTLNAIPAPIIALVYSMMGKVETLTRQELNDLHTFAHGRSNPDNLPASLIRLGEIDLQLRPPGQNAGNLYPGQALMVERVFQHKSWQECDSLNGSVGRREGTRQLRKWAREALKQQV